MMIYPTEKWQKMKSKNILFCILDQLGATNVLVCIPKSSGGIVMIMIIARALGIYSAENIFITVSLCIGKWWPSVFAQEI